MELSIPEHTMFFAGYLDAVGRVYTTEKKLFSLSASIIPYGSTVENILKAKIIGETDVADMTVAFEKAVSAFFGADPRERLLFYMIEYFLWFKEFSSTCVCKKYTLSFDKPPQQYLAYSLKVNGIYDIMLFLCTAERNCENA